MLLNYSVHGQHFTFNFFFINSLSRYKKYPSTSKTTLGMSGVKTTSILVHIDLTGSLVHSNGYRKHLLNC